MVAAERPETGGEAERPESVMLAQIVRRILGSETARLEWWDVSRVRGGLGSATGGVYRFSGTARDRDRLVPWSVMLKVVSLYSTQGYGASPEESHPLYWKREALAYGSGLLDDLPGGIHAPACYAVEERGTGTVWLWLEEVKNSYPAGWGLEQYAAAARHLGRFNGAYLAGRSTPSYPWLVQSGSPRGLLDHNLWARDAVADSATWRHPLLRSAFPVPVADRLLALWDGRGPLLDAIDRAPHTFCHLDAWRANMHFSARTSAAPLVLIDWAFPGYSAVGTDAGDLFHESYNLAELRDTEPRLLDEAVFDGYMVGLREAGWDGDESAVRFVFAAFCALKHACMLFYLPDVPHPEKHSSWEELFGRPFDELVHREAALIYYLLDLADEARHLMA